MCYTLLDQGWVGCFLLGPTFLKFLKMFIHLLVIGTAPLLQHTTESWPLSALVWNLTQLGFWSKCPMRFKLVLRDVTLTLDSMSPRVIPGPPRTGLKSVTAENTQTPWVIQHSNSNLTSCTLLQTLKQKVLALKSKCLKTSLKMKTHPGPKVGPSRISFTPLYPSIQLDHSHLGLRQEVRVCATSGDPVCPSPAVSSYSAGGAHGT